MINVIECANCGDRIGKLETPRVFGDQVVCESCWKKLNIQMDQPVAEEGPIGFDAMTDLLPPEISSPVEESLAQVARRMGGTVGHRTIVRHKPKSNPGKALQLVGAVTAVLGTTLVMVHVQRPEDFGMGMAAIGAIVLFAGLLAFGVGRFVHSQLKG